MRKPRTTIRRLMVIVLLIGLVMWAGLAAERTRSNKARFHCHYQSLGDPNDPQWAFSVTPEWVPFWPVYWRTFLGLHWDWRLCCVSGDGRRDVACEHDFPHIIVHDEAGRFADFDLKRFLAVLDGKQPSRGGAPAP
jgi:hypothetical protein